MTPATASEPYWAAAAERAYLRVDPGDVGAEVERWQQFRYGFRQFRPTGLEQLLAVDDVDGRWAVGDRTLLPTQASGNYRDGVEPSLLLLGCLH